MSERKGSYYVKDKKIHIDFPLISMIFSDAQSAESSVETANGLSREYIDIKVQGAERTRHYCVWEDLPLIYMPDYSEKKLLTIEGEHWIIKNIKLHAFTDDNDTLTEENEHHLFAGSLFAPVTGEIFLLQNPQNDSAVVIISENPDYTTATMTINKGDVEVENGGNALALGLCKTDECEALCRNYYRHARICKGLKTMSNTWGDMNGTARVCRDFVLREIDAAKEIGVDIVQIDDGWQIGQTYDPARLEPTGMRDFSGDFWSPDPGRFPNGMCEIADYAHKDNIKIGLWFAPDSHNNFALLDRDKEVLRQAYDEWGYRFFKIDMYWIRNLQERDRFIEFLTFIYSLGDDVEVQLDVTRNARLNYLCGREFGTLFVENRYTHSANSFPHRILRNIWMIGRYIPTSKFQFELLNPDLFKDHYDSSDPFAPSLYDMDYMFAVVMLSNPLFWMEMQFLSPKRRHELRRIMPVWRDRRESLADSDVEPIGQKPSGRSFSGFYVSKEGRPTYLLLFREVTESASAKFVLPAKISKARLIASNTTVNLDACSNEICTEFSKARAYAFIEIE